MSKEEEILKEILREAKQTNQFNYKLLQIAEFFMSEYKKEAEKRK